MLDCWTGIEFLKVLQDIRLSTPQFVTDFMMAVSSIVVYMALPILLFMIMFWFVDKRDGEFCMINAISAYMLASFVKFVVKQPRPYDIDQSIVPACKETSYSFPSGHSNIAVAGYGSLIIVIKNNLVRILLFILIILIIFSRMWLGVHTPLDMIGGIVLSLAVITVNWYLLKLSYRSERNYYIIGVCYIVVFAIMLVALAFIIDKDYKHMALGSGFLMGLFTARLVEHRYVGYEIPEYSTKNKVILGIIGVVGMALPIGIPYLAGIPALVFAGGFLSLMWGYVAFPYIMKNKVSFFARFCG